MLKRFVLALILFAAAPAADPARADPALWTVRGPKATVYLLGSVHALRPGTEWEGGAIRRAFDAAEECWFEVDLPDDPAVVQARALERAMDAGHKLSDLLAPEQKAELAALVTPGEQAFLDLMRPWFAALFVTTKPLLGAGYDPALGVDAVLRRRAKEAGKPVRGVESMDAQLDLVAGLPQDLALQMLADSLAHAADMPARVDRIVARWLAGDADGSMDDEAARLREEAPELYRRIFASRNEAFARAVRDLAGGDKEALVVLGAGHLSGPDNVRALLAKQGVAVERVPD